MYFPRGSVFGIYGRYIAAEMFVQAVVFTDVQMYFISM